MDNARLHEQLQRLAIVGRTRADLEGPPRRDHPEPVRRRAVPGDVQDQLESEEHEAAGRVDESIDSIHLAIGDIRNFIVGLRPGVSAGVPLVPGLAGIVEDARHHSTIDIELDAAPGVPEPSPQVTSHVLAILGEAVSNAVRHSGASAARVVVEVATVDPPALLIALEDNGAGFDPGTVARHGHQGLANMRDRAAAVGGALRIERREAGGTRVEIRVPLEAREGATHDRTG